MFRILFSTLFCFIFFTSIGKENRQFQFQNGDLLFQDIDCGELCDAIEKVTPALGKKHFSHVGIAYIVNDSIWVIEAIGADVHVTKIQDFLNRQLDEKKQPKVVVGRLKPAFQQLVPAVLTYALQQVGKPYDDAFLYNNGKYYCSELVYDAFKVANKGFDFFHLYPMTFKDPETHKTFGAWKIYYRSLKMKIPEGKAGCNPGSIAVNNNIDIVFDFYP